MEKGSARNQTLEQLHERRKQVVRLHKQGIKIMQIVAMTALSYPTVRAAIDLYEAGGWSAIRPALRGTEPIAVLLGGHICNDRRSCAL